MGYKLLITEFGINDLSADDMPTRDRELAAAGRDYLDLMPSYRQLDQFLWVALSEQNTAGWRALSPMVALRFGRPLRRLPA